VLAGDFELAALLGDLIKQASVFERDGLLIGERAHQADNGRRECSRLPALQNERSKRRLGTEQWDNERST
jgi:hypothetical protein